jgi:two-component system response regulator
MSASKIPTNNRLLIVDDREDDVFLLKHALKKGGITNPIDSLENGSLAVEHLKASLGGNTGSELPAMVLLDVKMPLMDGHEVLTWIRSQPLLNNLAVYMLSSSQLPDDISKARNCAAAGYWVKPSSLPEYNDLVAKVKTALAAR